MPKNGSGRVLSFTSAETTVAGTAASCHPLGHETGGGDDLSLGFDFSRGLQGPMVSKNQLHRLVRGCTLVRRVGGNRVRGQEEGRAEK
jgi:hypothetical protein